MSRRGWVVSSNAWLTVWNSAAADAPDGADGAVRREARITGPSIMGANWGCAADTGVFESLAAGGLGSVFAGGWGSVFAGG